MTVRVPVTTIVCTASLALALSLSVPGARAQAPAAPNTAPSAPAKPDDQAPAKPADQAAAKPGEQMPAKSTGQAPPKPGAQAPANSDHPAERPKSNDDSRDVFGANYDAAFKALFLLFVFAVILESALAILFNWRPFVETLNARAVRPVVSLIVALFVVFQFDLTIMTTLARLLGNPVIDFDIPDKILTAMVIAGGSAAVNNLLVSLGFRQVRTPETAVAKPPATKGWVSVSINRKQATGPVSVSIGTPDAAGQIPFAAMIDKSTTRGWRYFLRDRGRFPGSGGYPVHAGSVIAVEVTAPIGAAAKKTEKWGPHTIAEGAIIDLDFDV